MRGFRSNVTDCELHADSIHRGAGQILPCARRLFYACELSSDPSLLEPIFMCEITAPMEAMGGVYQVLNQRRGQVLESEQIVGTPLSLVTTFSYLRLNPICQSLNLSVSLVLSEEPPKERPSLSACSIIGNCSRISLLPPAARPKLWLRQSESARDLRRISPRSKTILTSCDYPNM